MRPLFLGLLLAVPAAASPAILLFPGVGTPSSLHVAGRVLKHTPTHGRSALSQNVRMLASSNWEGATVELRVAGRSATATSGHDGNFEVDIGSGAAPFEVGLLTVEAHVAGADPARALFDVLDPRAPFFVVSDFDDTIAITNVLEKTKLVESALLKSGDTQPPVPGMAALYACLREDKAHRPVFALVSGSPAQYSPRVQQFLGKNGFPTMGVFLRDLGPDTLSNYKQPVIRQLLTRVPQPVVFIGDSGEHDPEVYAQLRDEFPGRVKAIYIRNVGRADDVSRFKDMVLFTEPALAAEDAAQKGLVDTACVTRAFPKP